MTAWLSQAPLFVQVAAGVVLGAAVLFLVALLLYSTRDEL